MRPAPTAPTATSCDSCQHKGNRFAEPVQLEGGAMVCTWCETWRRETYYRHEEALMVLRFATKDARLRHLDDVERRRGKLARDRLHAEVLRIWEARRAKVVGT